MRPSPRNPRGQRTRGGSRRASVPPVHGAHRAAGRADRDLVPSYPAGRPATNPASGPGIAAAGVPRAGLECLTASASAPWGGRAWPGMGSAGQRDRGGCSRGGRPRQGRAGFGPGRAGVRAVAVRAGRHDLADHPGERRPGRPGGAVAAEPGPAPMAGRRAGGDGRRGRRGVLVRQVSVAQARAALALWGVCTPAGFAVSAAAGGLAASRAGWQDWFAALAAACAVLAGVVLALAHGQRRDAPAAPPPADPGRLPLAGALLLACGFGALSLMAVAILS